MSKIQEVQEMLTRYHLPPPKDPRNIRRKIKAAGLSAKAEAPPKDRKIKAAGRKAKAEAPPPPPPDIWRVLPHTFASRVSGGQFKLYKHIVILSHVIAQALSRGNARLVISLPPRHGKSWFISQWVLAWYLSNWPDKRVILASYEATFAATWGRRVRNIVKEHSALIGVSLSEDSTATNNWATTAGGGMKTSGAGGPLTGSGMDLGIIDDPTKNWQEAQSPIIRNRNKDWFDSTFMTRLEPGGSVLVIMTRWNQDDLIGHCLQQGGWKHVRIPAICEDSNDLLEREIGAPLCKERYDLPALLKIKSKISSLMWNALYQQRPAPAEGSLFKRENWQYYKIQPQVNFVLQSWDTASSKLKDAAFSVCQTWGISPMGAVLLAQWRERVEYPQLRRQAELQFMKWRPAVVLIEDKDSGKALCQSLQQETMIPVIRVNPEFSKEVRADAISPWQESKRIFLPDPLFDKPNNLWVAEFVENFTFFPNGTWRDEIDATSQAVAYISMKCNRGVGKVISGVPRKTPKLLIGYR